MISEIFDKIYCLHMVNDNKRKNHIVEHFKKYGLFDNTFITEFPTMNINNICGNLIKSIHTPYYDYMKANYGNIFSCAYNWLILIKSAYEQNLEHVLFLEDDVYFNVSVEELNNYFNNLPKDYDIIKFAYYFSSGYLINGSEDFNNKNNGDLFIKINNIYKLIDNSCFALSRKGMKYYIDYMEDTFSCADIPFCELNNVFFTDNLNYYITNKSLSNNFQFGSMSTNR